MQKSYKFRTYTIDIHKIIHKYEINDYSSAFCSTRLLRCLKNTIYMGVMAYNKSYRNNFLEQKVIINHKEETYEYVPAEFESIISME